MTALVRLAPTRGELREMARIAGPIVLMNVGLMMQGTVDTIMLGHLSSDALAAGAVANLYFYNVVVFGMGLLMSLDPVVAQSIGAGDSMGTARGVQRGIVIAVAASVLSAVAMFPSGAVLRMARQPVEVIPGAALFVRWSILGVLPWMLFTAFRQTLQAMHRVLPMALAVILANLLNAGLNWILIFGKFGVAPMGILGAAHATWISRWVMLLLLVWFAWPDLRPLLRPWHSASFAVAPLAKMLGIGAPVALQMFAEGFAFGLTGIIMGWFGAVTLAGHQITLIMASMTFMVPLGAAGAGAAMVGRAIGRGDLAAARRDAVAALACGIGFMAVMAVLFVSFPVAIAHWFTVDPATVAIAAILLPIAGMFQVFDGTQVVAASILRGTGDTRWPMIFHLLSFWALGIPLGLVLAFPAGFGAPGLWWGLTAGLASTAALQLARVKTHLQRDVARVIID